ncbi:hypothetical protein ACE193_13340 [Bernardetia sp. OM2101]|uniref:hypothetical protein n=1 Tax=Bernardetia sp. OM2101 TaxID=3344876 RepID=UPI0035CFF856
MSIFICFDKEEWKKESKILIILFMLILSYLSFYVTSEAITVCLLKFNSVSFDKTEKREFKLYKESSLENGYFGTYTDKKYIFEGYGYDILKVEKEDENYIKSVDKVTLKLKIGLLGVPYDPQIIK